MDQIIIEKVVEEITIEQIGVPGPAGPASTVPGPKGDDGDPGVGVPTGGTTAQILSKIDNTDYNTQWIDAPSGSGGAGTPVNTDITRLDNLHGTAGVTTNTAAGDKSLKNANGSSTENTAFGVSALEALTTGQDNTAVGFKALSSTNNNNSTAMGYESLAYSFTPGNNTAFGYRTFRYTSGDNNTGVGVLVGQNNDAGAFNSALGSQALYSNDSGNYNSALGYRALFTTNYNNTTGIGANAEVTGSNQVQLGDSATNVYAFAPLQIRSDERDKTDIRPCELGIEFIRELKPVTYKFDYRINYYEYKENYETVEVEYLDENKEKKTKQVQRLVSVDIIKKPRDGSKKGSRDHSGYLAQDFIELQKKGFNFGGIQNHLLKGGEDVLSIATAEINPSLVLAVQYLDKKIQELEEKLKGQ